MKFSTLRTAFLCLLPTLALATRTPTTPVDDDPIALHYLEYVTPEAEATIRSLEKMHDVKFSKPQPMLGNARTAELKGGGKISVRGPLRPDEEPTVRPYRLVDDIEAALEEAKDAGAEIAMAATPLPGHGTFAIYIHGGIQHGLWLREKKD